MASSANVCAVAAFFVITDYKVAQAGKAAAAGMVIRTSGPALHPYVTALDKGGGFAIDIGSRADILCLGLKCGNLLCYGATCLGDSRGSCGKESAAGNGGKQQYADGSLALPQRSRRRRRSCISVSEVELDICDPPGGGYWVLGVKC